MHRIDHILYATPDVEASVDDLEQRLGVRAEPGGRHPGFGTRNALLALGPTVYFEIIGPDANAPAAVLPRILDIDELEAPRVATWSVRGDDLEALVRTADEQGVDLGAIRAGSRMRPDGSMVSWQSTDIRAPREHGLVPFIIHWEDLAEHPAPALPAGCILAGLRAEHPDPACVRAALDVVGASPEITVGEAPAPALVITIESPRGTVEIR